MIIVTSKWREACQDYEFSAPPLYFIDSLTLNRIPLYKNKSLLHQKYIEEGLSSKQIASQFSCSTTAIKDHLHEFGIPIRRPRHHHGNPSIPKFGTKVRKGKSEPHIAERRVVRAILDLKAQGMSLRQICRFLTQMEVPTKRRGKGWHPEMVKRILISAGVYSPTMEQSSSPQTNTAKKAGS